MAQRFLMFLALLVAACGELGGEITDVREVRAPDQPIPHVTSARRFGFESRKARPSSTHGQSDPSFTYDLPRGWSEQPKTNLRLANFRVAGNEAAECYLTMLPGAAGGVLANVNRWRRQMGLGPSTTPRSRRCRARTCSAGPRATST